MFKTKSTASRLVTWLAAAVLAACGGGDAPPPEPPPAPGTYTIAGTVTGLAGAGLVLQNNLGDDLGVSADGAFTFATAVADGGSYSVSVRSQPANQSCNVAAGAGTVAGAAVTSVRVQCTTASTQAFPRQLFAIGGGFGEDEVGRLNAFGIDAVTGALTLTDSVAVDSLQPRPLVHPSGRFVYTSQSPVEAFRADDSTGQLTRIGTSLPGAAGRGGGAMDPLGRFALIGSGVYTIDAATGVMTRQTAPGISDSFASELVIDPRGRYAYSIEGFALGLARYALDAVTGVPTRETQPQPAGAVPRGLVIDPQGRFVFVVTAKSTGPDDGIQGFTVDAVTGATTPLPFVVSGLTSSRSIAIHPSGRWLLVTSESAVALFAVDTATGVVTRQASVPSVVRPTSARFDPSGTFVYIAEGDDNTLQIRRFDATTGAMQAAGQAPTQLFDTGGFAISTTGTSLQPGPRFAFTTSINDRVVRSWHAGANGTIGQVGTPILADQGTGPIDPQVHPSQRFVFVPESSGSLLPNDPNNNRGDALLRSYSIHAQTGALTQVDAFAVARNIFSLALGPGGRFAYALTPSGAASDPARGTVRVLVIDAQTGALSDAGAPLVTAGQRSVQLRIEPKGRFAYAVNETSNDVSAFAIDASGELVPAGTFFTSSRPLGIGFSPDGRFAYVRCLGDNTVVTYGIDATTGALTVVGLMPFGAGFSTIAVHPTRPYLYAGDFLAQRVTAYRIDTADGQPVSIGSGGGVNSPTPEFMQVDPSGRYLYAASASFGPYVWSVYRIDAASGALTSVGPAIATDSTTSGLAFTVGLQ